MTSLRFLSFPALQCPQIGCNSFQDLLRVITQGEGTARDVRSGSLHDGVYAARAAISN